MIFQNGNLTFESLSSELKIFDCPDFTNSRLVLNFTNGLPAGALGSTNFTYVPLLSFYTGCPVRPPGNVSIVGLACVSNTSLLWFDLNLGVIERWILLSSLLGTSVVPFLSRL